MASNRYKEIANTVYSNLKKSNLIRSFTPYERKVKEFAHTMIDGKRTTIWCTNDYMLMSMNQRTIDVCVEKIREFGIGSGGTRNISGTQTIHEEVEELIAGWYGKDRGLLFGSGFMANYGTLRALRSIYNPLFISDELNHASMILGMTESKKKVYRHNDMNSLESILKKHKHIPNKVIAFESLYSMEGTKGNVSDTIYLAKKYGAMTYCDEIHAVGIYGRKGSGVLEEENRTKDIDIIMGGMGKGLGGLGGFVCGDDVLVRCISAYASSYIFTTSLPPALCYAAKQNILDCMASYDQRMRFLENALFLKKKLIDAEFRLVDSTTESHILCVEIGSEVECKLVAKDLLRHGIYIQPIFYPTVPLGRARLRITPTLRHTEKMMDYLVGCLRDVV